MLLWPVFPLRTLSLFSYSDFHLKKGKVFLLLSVVLFVYDTCTFCAWPADSLVIVTDNLSGPGCVRYLLCSCILEVLNFACGCCPQPFHPLGSGAIPLAGIMHGISGKHYS